MSMVITFAGGWYGKEALKYSYEDIQSNLGVDRSIVARVVELFHATGKVSRRPYTKDRAARKLTNQANCSF